MSDTKKLPRYVELIRVSTAQQADRDTPEMQRQALDRLRETRPGIFVERIEELGVSGTLKLVDRPHLQRLIQLADNKAFDELRVYAVDRITRTDDRRDRAAILGALADAGAMIVDRNGTEHLTKSDDGMAEILLDMQAVVSAKEAIKIRGRIRDGKRRMASQGLAATGHIPYGRTFDKVTRVWGVDEAKARCARRMFGLCIDGYSLAQIAEVLNDEGFRTPSGKTWLSNNVAKLLKDRSMAGTWVQSGIEVPVPPLVSVEAFEAASRSLAGRRSLGRGRHSPRIALLARRLTCGFCGGTVQVHGHREHGYYLCSSHFRRRDRTVCPEPRHGINIKIADAALRAELERLLDDPRLIVEAADALVASLDDRTPALRERVADLEAQLAKVAAGRQRVLDMVVEDLISEPDSRAKLVALKSREEKLKLDLETARDALQEAEAAQGSRTSLEERIGLIRERIATVGDEDWAELVALLFPRRGGLRLFHDRIEGEGVLPSLERLQTLQAAEPQLGWVSSPLL